MTKITNDPNSLLVINSSGVLQRLRCPFLVKLIEPVKGLEFRGEYQVQSVMEDTNRVLVYFVLGKPYYYFNFCIEL